MHPNWSTMRTSKFEGLRQNRCWKNCRMVSVVLGVSFKDTATWPNIVTMFVLIKVDSLQINWNNLIKNLTQITKLVSLLLQTSRFFRFNKLPIWFFSSEESIGNWCHEGLDTVDVNGGARLQRNAQILDGRVPQLLVCHLRGCVVWQILAVHCTHIHWKCTARGKRDIKNLVSWFKNRLKTAHDLQVDRSRRAEPH